MIEQNTESYVGQNTHTHTYIYITHQRHDLNNLQFMDLPFTPLICSKPSLTNDLGTKRGAMIEFRRETTSRFGYGGCVEREREGGVYFRCQCSDLRERDGIPTKERRRWPVRGGYGEDVRESGNLCGSGRSLKWWPNPVGCGPGLGPGKPQPGLSFVCNQSPSRAPTRSIICL